MMPKKIVLPLFTKLIYEVITALGTLFESR